KDVRLLDETAKLAERPTISGDFLASGANRPPEEAEKRYREALDKREADSRRAMDQVDKNWVTRSKGDPQARYWEAKRNLEELTRSAQILSMKLASEKFEADLPKTKMVDILDKAAPPTKDPGLLERLRRAAGGKVASTARLKIESPAAEIAFTGKPFTGAYD